MALFSSKETFESITTVKALAEIAYNIVAISSSNTLIKILGEVMALHSLHLFHISNSVIYLLMLPDILLSVIVPAKLIGFDPR